MPGRHRFLLPVAVVGGILLVAGCADTPTDPETPDASASPTATDTAAPSPTATAAPAPVPSGAVLSNTVLPADCASIADEAVLVQLSSLPLNDPSYGDSGQLPDRSLRCVWGQPGADTTKLITTINYAPENDVLDYLNVLMAEGFTCYEPAGGVRCEHTWENASFPVTDGRTLFYRDGVLIDTQYSNVAPAGYTDSIVRTIWPQG